MIAPTAEPVRGLDEAVRQAQPRLRFWAPLSAFLVLLTALRIGDVQVRLGNIHVHDDVLGYVRFLSDPARYAGDLISTYGFAHGLGTIQNWLPWLLWRFLGVPPEAVVVLWICIQNVGLGLSVAYFARVVTGRRDVALMAVLLAMAAQPWNWNFADYVGVLQAPYTQQLAMPVFVLAFAMMAQRRALPAIALLTLAGLIHPSLGLQTSAIAFCYLVLAYWRQGLVTVARHALALIVPVAVCTVPALLLQLPAAERLERGEHVRLLRMIFHIVPWEYPATSYVHVVTTAAMIAFGFLALRYGPPLRSDYATLWLGAAAACAVLAAAAVAGVVVGVIPLLQLMPLRATTMLAVIALPGLALYLVEKLRDPSLAVRASGAIVLVGWMVTGWGGFWPLLLGLLLADLAEGRLGVLTVRLPPGIAALCRRGVAAGLALWAVLVTLAATCLPTDGGPYGRACALVALPTGMIAGPSFAPESAFYWRYVLAAGITAAAVAAAWLWRGRLVAAVGALAAALALVVAVDNGLETLDPEWRANADAQLWARDNTSPDAVFLVYKRTWRALAERAVVDPHFTLPYAIYSGSQRGKAIGDAYLDFYGLDVTGLTLPAAFEAVDRAEARLGRDDFLRMGARFGGDYLVRPIDRPLDLPVAYRNERLVVYEVARP